MIAKRKPLILLIIVACASITLLSFCGNNPFHQLKAAGVLTMGECLECHDGKMAKAVTICLGKECLYLKNHSIMDNYPPLSKPGEYASRSEIELAGCVLENGKTTCLSCHDLTKPPPHLIQEGDRLCVLCHIHLKSS